MRRSVAYTRLACDVLLLAVFILATIEARDFQERARWFPMFVGLLGAVLVGVQLVRDVIVFRRGGDLMGGGIEYGPPRQVAQRSDVEDLEAAGAAADSGSADADNGRAYVRSWVAVVILVVLMATVGTVIGVSIWLATVLYFVAKTRPWFVIVTTAATIAILLFLHDYIQLALPRSLIPGFPFM